MNIIKKVVLTMHLLAFGMLHLSSSLANSLTSAEMFWDNPLLEEGYGIPLTLDLDSNILKTAINSFDTSSLTAGPHTIYFRFKDSNGEWSNPIGLSVFLDSSNPPQPFTGGANRIVKAEVFIDLDPGEGKGIELSIAKDGTIDETIEELSRKLSSITIQKGVHIWHTRFLDRTGVWSPTIKTSFLAPYTITSSGNSNSFWLMVLPAIIGNRYQGGH